MQNLIINLARGLAAAGTSGSSTPWGDLATINLRSKRYEILCDGFLTSSFAVENYKGNNSFDF